MDRYWILLADWYDSHGEEHRECDYYFFDTAEEGLDFAYSLCHSKSAWEDAGKPYNLSLHNCKKGEPFPEGGGYYMAAWFELDKKIRDKNS